MGAPEVPIEVDGETGVWSTDGLPMLYVPRHFLLDNHLAVERALGHERHARLLYEAGYKSAYTWCGKEAETHGLRGEAVFHHYMRRLSQRGWARFTTIALRPAEGIAEVRVEHSCFVLGFKDAAGGGAGDWSGRKVCHMFAGWFPGALAWVAEQEQGTPGTARRAEVERHEMRCQEIRCAAERDTEVNTAGDAPHCLFRVGPAA